MARDRTTEKIQRENERKLSQLLKEQDKISPRSPRRTARRSEVQPNPRRREDFNRLLEELAENSR